MTIPLISVILPVFNAVNYIGQAVESILQQTVMDFEFIIIDDGSTDNSLKVIKKYAESDRRIIIVSRENRGLIASLNEGIQLAQGEWIARMDADDICDPARIECQLKYCIENGVDICGSHIEIFGVGKPKIRKYPLLNSEIRFGLAMNTQFAHPAVFARSECFRSLKYSELYKHCEDYDLWVRAVYSGYILGNVDMVLLKYRLHPDQISVTQARSQFLATLKIAEDYRARVCAAMVDRGDLNSDVLRIEKNKSQRYPCFIIWQLLCIAKACKCAPKPIENYLIWLSKRDRSIELLGVYECLGMMQIFGQKRFRMFLRCVFYKLIPVEIYAFMKNIYSILYAR